jgi:hypothetical protein
VLSDHAAALDARAALIGTTRQFSPEEFRQDRVVETRSWRSSLSYAIGVLQPHRRDMTANPAVDRLVAVSTLQP